MTDEKSKPDDVADQKLHYPRGLYEEMVKQGVISNEPAFTVEPAESHINAPVVKVEPPQNITGGTFKIHIGPDVETAPIPFDATADVIRQFIHAATTSKELIDTKERLELARRQLRGMEVFCLILSVAVFVLLYFA